MKTYLRVARPDHWFKNVFMLIGTVAAVAYEGVSLDAHLILKICAAVFLACLMSSANYIINEVVDARFDKKHPNKKLRSVASGSVSVKKLIYFDVLLVIFTLAVSYLAFNEKFFLFMVLFFIIGGISYNIPPVRTKDLPYVDVIGESVNNPLRLMLGWHVLDGLNSPPPATILCCWSLGAALMTAKRLAELRFLGEKSAEYRPTFNYYSDRSLTAMYSFYAVMTLAAFAYFSLRYGHGTFYFLPFILVFFIWFTFITFQQNSIVKEPERLFEKKAFVIYCLLALFIFCRTLFL